jgi:transcriptional regulator of acetoin/glycerol metabolism
VLEQRRIMRVGGTDEITVDVRVICATHRDLEALVAVGQFRADLYARLSGHTFSIPPLRERREDLGRLTAALLRDTTSAHAVRFEPDAVRAICLHDWPFNVRELEKCLTSAVILARGGVIGLEHLPTALVAPSTEAAITSSEARRVDRRDRLAAALRSNRGNVSAVARSLGKARSQVQRWIHDCGLDPALYRDP